MGSMRRAQVPSTKKHAFFKSLQRDAIRTTCINAPEKALRPLARNVPLLLGWCMQMCPGAQALEQNLGVRRAGCSGLLARTDLRL